MYEQGLGIQPLLFIAPLPGHTFEYPFLGFQMPMHFIVIFL